MTRFGLAIDEALCWGCKTCEVACKQENRTPDGVQLIRVTEDGPRQVDGKWHFSYRVNRCRHCDEPPCVDACPVAALDKRRDGVVVLDRAACVGCRDCLDACPFEAVAFDQTVAKAVKCDLCRHRLDAGLLPACADNVCLAHCIQLTQGEGAVP